MQNLLIAFVLCLNTSVSLAQLTKERPKRPEFSSLLKKVERKPGQEEDVNCFIRITQVAKTDEVSSEVFSFKRKSKSDCKKLADSYRPNFAPHIVKEKTVEFVWDHEGKGE